MNLKVIQALLLIVCLQMPLVLQAKPSGWLSTGLTYTQDLAVQTTMMQGLMNNPRLSRSGIETGAGIYWSRLNEQGGYSIGLQGLYDKGASRDTDISNLALSAGRMWPVSTAWLFKANGTAARYRNDAFRRSGYNAMGIESTLGYFGEKYSGLDFTLGLTREDHDQDASAEYQTHRSRIELSYYLPHKKAGVSWAIQVSWENNNATNRALDYSSRQLKVSLGDWALGKTQGGLALQWRQDRYSHPMMVRPAEPTGLPGSGSQNSTGPLNPGMNATMATGSRRDREDTLYYLSLNFVRPLRPQWSLLLSTQGGIYQSEPMGSERSFYDVTAAVRWEFE